MDGRHRRCALRCFLDGWCRRICVQTGPEHGPPTATDLLCLLDVLLRDGGRQQRVHPYRRLHQRRAGVADRPADSRPPLDREAKRSAGTKIRRRHEVPCRPPDGRLGNQMFQYAFGRRLALATGTPVSLRRRHRFSPGRPGATLVIERLARPDRQCPAWRHSPGMGWKSPWHRLARLGWSAAPARIRRVMLRAACVRVRSVRARAAAPVVLLWILAASGLPAGHPGWTPG
jgi:hypothetical protein